MADLRHSLLAVPPDPASTVLDPPTEAPGSRFLATHNSCHHKHPSLDRSSDATYKVGPRPVPPPDRRRQGAAWGPNAGEAWKWPEVALFRRRHRRVLRPGAGGGYLYARFIARFSLCLPRQRWPFLVIRRINIRFQPPPRQACTCEAEPSRLPN